MQDFSCTHHAARNTRRDLTPWSNAVNDSNEVPSRGPGDTLSDETHAKLEYIRDQLYMIAAMILVVTQEEDDHLLEMQRGALGSCFMNFGSLVDEVLDGVNTPSTTIRRTPRVH
jgi:hypothetical protein